MVNFRATSEPERSSLGSGSWVVVLIGLGQLDDLAPLLLLFRVRLAHSVSLVFGDLDDFGKLDVTAFDLAKLVEDVRQGSRKDTLDLDDL